MVHQQVLRHLVGFTLSLSGILLLSIPGGCSSGTALEARTQQTSCELVICVERKKKYTWNYQLKKYRLEDVGCQRYRLDPKCIHRVGKGDTQTSENLEFQQTHIFSETSCIRRLVRNTQYTISQAQVLCRNPLKTVEKDPAIKRKRDACVDRSLRSGSSVRQAIKECYWGDEGHL